MTLFTVYCYCEQLGFNRGCLLTVDLASRLLLKRSPTVGHVEPVHRLPPGPRDPGQRGHGELGSPHRGGLIVRREDGDETAHDDAVDHVLRQPLVLLAHSHAHPGPNLHNILRLITRLSRVYRNVDLRYIR